MKSFLIKNIMTHLQGLGLDEYNSEFCAEEGYKMYQRSVCNSKDPFKDSCNFAGVLAEQRVDGFKYKAPKAKSTRRQKKPQEAFKF